MQLEMQPLSWEDIEEPGAGIQASKQFSLIFYRRMMMSRESSEQKQNFSTMTYLDQKTGIVHGGFLLELLDDGSLDIGARLRGRRGRAGTEERHDVLCGKRG